MTTLAAGVREVTGRVRDFFLTEPTAVKFLYGADAEHPLPGVIFDDSAGKRPVAVDSEGLVLPWARVTAIDGEAPQQSMGTPGNRLYKPGGVLFVQLFMRRGLGMTTLRALGDLLVAYLRLHRGSVVIRNPAFKPIVDREPDSPWRQGNVTAEYDFHQLG